MSAIRDVWEKRGRGLAGPRFSDLIFTWLREKIGEKHEINIIPSITAPSHDQYSIRVDGILIGWVDDDECTYELASGDDVKTDAIRRRRRMLKSADPSLFDEIWARIQLIDKDCVEANGYSITEKK